MSWIGMKRWKCSKCCAWNFYTDRPAIGIIIPRRDSCKRCGKERTTEIVI